VHRHVQLFAFVAARSGGVQIAAILPIFLARFRQRVRFVEWPSCFEVVLFASDRKAEERTAFYE
jgi:hypothetical protein